MALMTINVENDQDVEVPNATREVSSASEEEAEEQEEELLINSYKVANTAIVQLKMFAARKNDGKALQNLIDNAQKSKQKLTIFLNK